MTTPHPPWCTGVDPDEDHHVSATVQAAVPTDGVDITLRLEELPIPGGRQVPVVVLELREEDETFATPLLLPQAERLRDALSQVLDAYQGPHPDTPPPSAAIQPVFLAAH